MQAFRRCLILLFCLLLPLQAVFADYIPSLPGKQLDQVHRFERGIAFETVWPDVELTGDWRSDLITVSRLFLGYRESTTETRYDKTLKRSIGTTRFGKWIGYPYVDWCSAFISYCFDKAGVTDAAAFKATSVTQWIAAAKNKGVYEKAPLFVPVPGDVVFIAPDEATRAGHMGIVEFVTATTVGTIEGNAGSAVARRLYRLGDARLTGRVNMHKLMEQNKIHFKPIIQEYIALSSVREKVHTKTDQINLRAEPDEGGTMLIRIPKAGTRLTVIGAVDVDGILWNQVLFRNHLGYIRADLLRVVKQQ